MSAIPRKHWTAEEYLMLDEASDTRHEFFAGEIYAMTGASPRHVDINNNLIGCRHALADICDGIDFTDD